MPTPLGAVRALDDLAGDKLPALFSRAEPRDFLDVAGLLHRYHRHELETFAAAKDLGFNRSVLADAFGVLPTIRRDRFDVDDATYTEMLETFRTWRADLDANRREGAPLAAATRHWRQRRPLNGAGPIASTRDEIERHLALGQHVHDRSTSTPKPRAMPFRVAPWRDSGSSN